MKTLKMKLDAVTPSNPDPPPAVNPENLGGEQHQVHEHLAAAAAAEGQEDDKGREER